MQRSTTYYLLHTTYFFYGERNEISQIGKSQLQNFSGVFIIESSILATSWHLSRIDLCN
jgi:hypothetical protein